MTSVVGRLGSVLSHLKPDNVTNDIYAKHPDDAVIVMAVRSPLCKSFKGSYKDMRDDELMTSMFKATIEKMATLNVKPEQVNEVVVGIVNGTHQALFTRAAMLAAGFPNTTTWQTVNRFCSSGLMAVSNVANQIRNGEIEIGLAMGFEHLSATMNTKFNGFSEEIMAHHEAKDCVMPMGWTAENVAGDFNISRQDMDKFALASHTRAEKAAAAGLFEEEIIPLEVFQKVDKDSTERKKVTIRADDGLRKGTTLEGLSKVKSAFPQWAPGQTTGGNASQVTDGSAVVLMMRRSKAESLGLPILAKHVATCLAGLPPRIMGIAPTLAIPKVLARTGLTKEQIDLWEINEAFASMYVYCVNTLGLDLENVNVNGGAIAFGHPFGCTGARQVATGLAELRRRKGRILCTSMCIGYGQGAAAIFVAEY